MTEVEGVHAPPPEGSRAQVAASAGLTTREAVTSTFLDGRQVGKVANLRLQEE